MQEESGGGVRQAVPEPVGTPRIGGRQLDQVYISTARLGLSAEDLGQLEQSGGIYRWDSPVKGLPENHVRHL